MKNIFKIQFFLLMFLLISGNLFAQLKLSESFTGVTFPPPGWSSAAVLAGDGIWVRTTAQFRTAPASAFSRYSTLSGNNYLITKRFVPAAGDSLVFWLRQTFTTNYSDTLKIRVSNTDSLVGSFGTILFTLSDGQYPTVPNYGRFAISLSAYAGSTIWIAFQHVDTDGESLSIDDVTVGPQPANEVAGSNVAPVDTINTNYTYAPKATFTNTGTNNQFNVSVTYQITGPTNYTSTKNIDTLLSAQAKTITFDSTFTPADTGSYTVSISNSVSAQATTASFKVVYRDRRVQAGGCNYWWANSQALVGGNPFPNRPTYGWKDPNNTPNKVVMVNNGVNQLGTKLDGTLDDGNYNYGDTLTALGKCIRVCGNAYNGFYPGTNGIISLTRNNTRPANINTFTVSQGTGPVGDSTHAVLLPFFRDFNFANVTGQPANRFSFYISRVGGVAKELIVTWENIVIFGGGNTDNFSFQAVIELKDCGATTNSNIRYNYNVSKTGAGFLTKYGNGQPNTVLSATGFLSDGSNMIGIRPNGGAMYYRKDGALVGGTVFHGPLFTDASGSLAVEFGDNGTPLNKGNNRALLFKLFIEGFRLSGSTLLDTVRIQVKDVVSPYTILETIPGVFDASGVLTLSAGYIYTGANYYLVAQHRNSIRTWTNVVAGPAADNTLSYDLTTSLSQALGSNQVLVNGAASIFSGDVNQDGVVDVTDAGLVDNDAFNFVSGYVPTDVNGDNVTDISDASIVDNNSFNFVTELAPPGPVAPAGNYNALIIEKATQSEISTEEVYRIEKLNQELRLTSPVKIR